MRLTIALPGLFWQDTGDLDYIYSNTKLDNFNFILKHSSMSTYKYNFSDLLYSQIKEDGSLADYLAQRAGVLNEYKSFLLAEPTHLRLDRDRLLISESELLQLYSQESINIIEEINNHFAPEIKLYKITDNLWLLGHNMDLKDTTFYPILDIAGENIDDFMPSIGLNKLINEVQMLLTNLPDNKNRQKEGSLVANSIWVWNKKLDKNSNKTHVFNEIYSNIFNPLSGASKPIPKNITTAFNDNNLIIIDNLYYPCYYRDSFGYTEKIMTLDSILGFELKKWLLQKNELDILVPGRESAIKISIRRSYKFWQNKQLINLVKEFHAL